MIQETCIVNAVEFFLKPVHASLRLIYMDMQLMRETAMDIEELVRRSKLRQVLQRSMVNPHLVDDICQNVLLKCWLYLRQHGTAPPVAYVVRTGLNEFRSWARRRRPERLPDDYDQASHEPDPALKTTNKERSIQILSILNSLPPLYRDVAVPHLLERRSIKELSQRTGLSPNAVKSRLHRARAVLREKLRGYFRN